MLKFGIDPLNLLYEICKYFNCVRLPIEPGIDPTKLHLHRFIFDNILRLPIEDGNAPEKPVSKRNMV